MEAATASLKRGASETLGGVVLAVDVGKDVTAGMRGFTSSVTADAQIPFREARAIE